MLRKLLLLVALALVATIGLGAGSAQAVSYHSCYATAFHPVFTWPLVSNQLHIVCEQGSRTGGDWPIAAQVDDYLYDSDHGAWLHVPSYGWQKFFTPYSNLHEDATQLWDQTWTTPCPDGRYIGWAHYAVIQIIDHNAGSGNPGFNHYGQTITVWSDINPFACT